MCGYAADAVAATKRYERMQTYTTALMASVNITRARNRTATATADAVAVSTRKRRHVNRSTNVCQMVRCSSQVYQMVRCSSQVYQRIPNGTRVYQTIPNHTNQYQNKNKGSTQTKQIPNVPKRPQQIKPSPYGQTNRNYQCCRPELWDGSLYLKRRKNHVTGN